MTCVKTGCHIYLIPYGTFAYGDAHEVAGALFFRLVSVLDQPLSNVLHYEINNFDSWWGKEFHSGVANITGPTSTLVCDSADVISYGYDGRDIREFDHITARLK